MPSAEHVMPYDIASTGGSLLLDSRLIKVVLHGSSHLNIAFNGTAAKEEGWVWNTVFRDSSLDTLDDLITVLQYAKLKLSERINHE